MTRIRETKKRVIVLVLSMALLFSVLPVQSILAADVSREQASESVSEQEKLPGESEESVAKEVGTDNTGEESEAVGQSAQDSQPAEVTESMQEEQNVSPELQYVYVDKSYVAMPERQKILVSFGENTSLSDAVLVYSREGSGESQEVQASELQESSVLFQMDYVEESQAGVYQLLAVRMTVNGEEYELDFQEAGIDSRFGVNRECETEPDAVVEEIAEGAQSTGNKENDVTFVTVDSEGNLEEKGTVEEVLSEASERVATVSTSSEQAALAARAVTHDLVVVLDPGHGGGDPGAGGNGANEKDLTLKIAKYCKNALEEYCGVTVYMTRETDRFVGANSTNANEDLAPRVEYAKSVNADLFVSIHLNSTGYGTAKGAEVYYPNSNYNVAVGNTGKEVAQNIQNELVALGITDRGIKIRNSANNSTYPDGSLQDYYAVIWQCKRAGIPGIIVEHAFIDNVDDYNKYLNSDAKLKKLGEADAAGIAKALGLEKGEWIEDKNGWWFRYSDGSYPKSTWKFIAGYWYHFGSDGYRQTGFITDGAKYYLDKEGKMAIGWKWIDDAWYYFNGSGAMATGWLWQGGAWYYLDKDGKMVTGWQTIDKTKYYFGTSGNMYTGTHVIDGTTCVFSSSGAYQITEGWKSENGKWYYMTGGVSAKGWSMIDNTWYYFDGSGVMQTGWVLVGGTWYYMNSSGKMLTGFQKIGNLTYYLSSSGAMVTGWLLVDKTWYYFNGSGAMQTGWLLLGNTWYYLNSDGKMATGLQKIGNATYYLTSSGAMAVGWVLIDKTWYYFNGSGAIQTGWVTVDGKRYYLKDDGKMATGWLTVNGAMYYFGTSGNMYTGTHVIDNVTYQFDASGACQSKEGWKTENGKTYYLVSGTAAKGWKFIENAWYYFEEDTGVMATGWLGQGDAWYYLKDSGVMQTGWLLEGNNWYYLNPETNAYGPAGVMAKGYREINGTWYYFEKTKSPVGSLSYEGVTPIMGESAIGKDKETVVKKMVRMFGNRTYPSEALEKGGAPDITTFCRILYDEAVLEGVKPEVVFGQAMKETGHLQFGGDVKVEQFNFAGLGATGNGEPGNSYESVQIGLRAQVQHLKAYASDEELKSECVDNRFKYVTRKCAPYVEWLGIQENPEGKGWAAEAKYGMSIMNSYIKPLL